MLDAKHIEMAALNRITNGALAPANDAIWPLIKYMDTVGAIIVMLRAQPPNQSTKTKSVSSNGTTT